MNDLPKASDLLRVVDYDEFSFIENRDTVKNDFPTKSAAQTLIDLWDKAHELPEYQKENEYLISLLRAVMRGVDSGKIRCSNIFMEIEEYLNCKNAIAL